MQLNFFSLILFFFRFWDGKLMRALNFPFFRHLMFRNNKQYRRRKKIPSIFVMHKLIMSMRDVEQQGFVDKLCLIRFRCWNRFSNHGFPRKSPWTNRNLNRNSESLILYHLLSVHVFTLIGSYRLWLSN